MGRKKNSKATTAPLDKLAAIRDDIDGALFEREDETVGMLVALLAREHILFLGKTGTAKSLLTRLACGAIEGARYFERLLTKFSTPEELFGPVSIKAMEEGKYERITAGKAPWAHVFFPDEIFKANSAILNALLTLINERKFHNDGTTMDCPLMTVAGASNELPEDESLAALYDRFLIRYWIGYIQDHDNEVALVKGNARESIAASMTLDDLAALQDAVDQVHMSDEVAMSIVAIKRALQSKGIVCSDRRWSKVGRVLRAFALLNGHAEVEDDDVLFLQHVLWDNPDQRVMVREEVGKVASPLTAEAVAIFDAAKEAHGELLTKEGTPDFLIAAVDLRATLKEMRTRLTESIRAAGGKASRAEKVVEQLRGLQADVKRRSDRALD
jgi:MoxR-like ATPase